eukprot:gene4448-5459_t
MAELARFSCDQLGTIDRWINNAGVVSEKVPLFEVSTEDIATVCSTNVLGHKEGIGAAHHVLVGGINEGKHFPLGFGAALAVTLIDMREHHLSARRLRERQAGVTSVGVHNLSPGMVVTDLLLKGSTPVARRFFNVLAEEAETVAATLAPQVRQVSGTNGSLEYLSLPDAFRRVVTGVPQIINGGRFFDKEGNRVPERGAKYQSPCYFTQYFDFVLLIQENGVRKWYEVPAEEELCEKRLEQHPQFKHLLEYAQHGCPYADPNTPTKGCKGLAEAAQQIADLQWRLDVANSEINAVQHKLAAAEKSDLTNKTRAE